MSTNNGPGGEDISVGESVLVVGAGDMGRWIAGVLGAPETVFVDTDEDVAQDAAEQANGRAFDPRGESAEAFDLVVIAVPISEAAAAIETYGPRATRGIVDVTGVMKAPLEAMATYTPAVAQVSLHPLFAPERAPGRIAVVSGHDSEDPAFDESVGNGGEREGSRTADAELSAAIETALRAAGNEPFGTTAAEHDTAMETVQARTHAAVLAFSLAADPVREQFHTPVSAALADLASQVTNGTPRTYAEIQSTFPGAESVAQAAARIAEASPEAFETLFLEAGDRESSGEQS